MSEATLTPDTCDATCDAALRRLEPEKQAVWLGFLRAHSLLLKRLDADLTARAGLPLSAFEALSRIAIAPDGRLRMSEVASETRLSQSRASRLVSELEERGLLERASCPEDERVVYATLTDRGRELLEQVQDIHFDGIERRFFGALEPEEIELLAGVWPRVIAAATAA